LNQIRRYYDFPLFVGKKWDDEPYFSGGRWQKDSYTVERTETITVPAGTFQTSKIVLQRGTTQRGSATTIYYAPLTKSAVKVRSEGTGGTTFEYELIEYGNRTNPSN
jgi:hypothetical protein